MKDAFRKFLQIFRKTVVSGTLPKRVDDFFIKAIQALLKGFEPVVVDAKDLMDKLTKLPPMDEVSFKQKLN